MVELFEFNREVDESTDLYRHGLLLGLWHIDNEMHDVDGETAGMPEDTCDGYRDAVDDSDDMPEPFDPEETFVP